MTVETLDQMMNYVIEGWMLISGAYLGVTFLGALVKRMMQDMQAEMVALEQSLETSDAVTDTEVDVERLAAVSAVAEKYAKASNSETVSTGVSVTESSNI